MAKETKQWEIYTLDEFDAFCRDVKNDGKLGQNFYMALAFNLKTTVKFRVCDPYGDDRFYIDSEPIPLPDGRLALESAGLFYRSFVYPFRIGEGDVVSPITIFSEFPIQPLRRRTKVSDAKERRI